MKVRMLILAMLVALSSHAADVKYTFQTLAYPGAFITLPAGINDHGDIVGTYRISFFGSNHAFLFQNGQYFQIDKPGAVTSSAVSINNAGQIAGSAAELHGTDTEGHAFLRMDETHYTTIEPPRSLSSGAFAMNNLGDILGVATAPTAGFLYSRGTFLPGLGGPYGLDAYALNSSLQHVGYNVPNSPDPFCGCYDSFLTDWKNSTTILAFPGAQVTQANAINDAGQVAGTYVVLNNPGINATVQHRGGFVYTNGHYQGVDFPGAFTELSGINGFGDVVGTYGSTQGFVALAERPFTVSPSNKWDAPMPLQRLMEARTRLLNYIRLFR